MQIYGEFWTYPRGVFEEKSLKLWGNCNYLEQSLICIVSLVCFVLLALFEIVLSGSVKTKKLLLIVLLLDVWSLDLADGPASLNIHIVVT